MTSSLRTVTGVSDIVAKDGSALGAGWDLNKPDRLVSIAADANGDDIRNPGHIGVS
jgi:hypothetical protein